MKSTLRLFRAVPVKTKKKKKLTRAILKKTIKFGFVLSEEIIGNYPGQELENVIKEVRKVTGLSGAQANSAFHKSWKKIKDANITDLVIEQLIHYFTTYGLENLGVYNEKFVYLPAEKLEVPDLDVDKIFLIRIKGYTNDELKSKLTELLQSGIALEEKTINDVVDVATYLELDADEIEEIKNKEVRVMLYDYLGKIPKNPTEFLRLCIYKSIDKTLLIKDAATIEQIKEKKNINVLGLFVKYKKEHGLEKLAEIFYRFKPLFLAFKTTKKLKTLINKTRKLAVKYHKPMPEDYLNNLTGNLGDGVSIEILSKELKKVNIFRKIRLAYALKYRTKDVNSILYKIRNGKGYATDFDFAYKREAKEALEEVIDSIVEDVRKNVEGKKIYIPDNIVYALPATEKQFTGNFPSGTCVKIPKDMIVGVHWKNVKDKRIDLDLSLLDVDGKFGWDADYRDEKREILFSGDMTDAQGKGASELFYIKKQITRAFLLSLNYYNYSDAEVEVPISIFVAQNAVKNMKENYMVDPNSVVAVSQSSIDKKQKVLGLLVVNTIGNKFYFSDIYLGNSITSSNSEYAKHARKYLLNFYKNSISLNKVLELAGAELIKDPEVEGGLIPIDLSPDKLEKDSIIKLLYG